MKKNKIEFFGVILGSAIFLMSLAYLSGCDYTYDYSDYKVKFIDGQMKGSVKIQTMKEGYVVGDTVFIDNSNAVITRKINGSEKSVR